MYIHLSQEDVKPLYQQIADQVKMQIMDGTVEPGQELPSIRQLAQQLLTSVITVKRAYDDLEREGYIYTRQGLGTFVAHMSASQLDAIRYEQAEYLLAQSIEKCRTFGLKDEEIQKLIAKLLRRVDHDNRG